MSKLAGPFLAAVLGLSATLAQAVATNDLESTLRQIQSADITYEAIGRLYQMRTNAPNTEIQSEVVRICAASLLYVTRPEVYTSHMRRAVPNVGQFEKALLLPCEKCKGEGKALVNCAKCGSDGNCKSFNCQRGQAEYRGMNGQVSYRPCPACKGAGKCLTCQGGDEVTGLR